ncbi:partner of Y14 and mago isoform X1 [Athalia rosae]|uniref:partner of Y14 and mago isoform X1 n=1 Tax=Athalia rosae TaxID=37344 RepID=UPI0020348EA1|nr:partner of Y14 and mago isoform X1 [Athalia rosae]
MASAYIKDEQGHLDLGGTFIPASQRPDGTWRKPRRVKDGYVPQEEVPLYESKGKQFTKNQPSYPVGMSAEYVAAHKAKKEAQAAKLSPVPLLVLQNNANKKKKKKNNSKPVEAITEELLKSTISENGKQDKNSGSTANQSTDPAKRLKNLRKKLREIETLEQKLKGGELKNPEKEILDKISRKSEVEEEIEELEARQL